MWLVDFLTTDCDPTALWVVKSFVRHAKWVDLGILNLNGEICGLVVRLSSLSVESSEMSAGTPTLCCCCTAGLGVAILRMGFVVFIYLFPCRHFRGFAAIDGL